MYFLQFHEPRDNASNKQWDSTKNLRILGSWGHGKLSQRKFLIHQFALVLLREKVENNKPRKQSRHTKHYKPISFDASTPVLRHFVLVRVVDEFDFHEILQL